MDCRQDEFSKTLRSEVMTYFVVHDRSIKGNIWLHTKPLIFLSLMGVSYWGLVFHSSNFGTGFLWCLVMIFAMGGIGFGFAHDSCHGAFSRSRFWNRVTGCGYDLMGASSYVWRWKHNVLHHGSPNHLAHDPDVQTAPFLRISPDQPLRPFNRYQQFYFPLLYFLILFRWQLWQDFATYFKGELLGKKFIRPSGIDFMVFWGGKFIVFFFTFVFPSFFVPFSHVLLAYFFVMGGLGVFLGILIQIAHCTEGASFESQVVDGILSQKEQVHRTSNFCPRNWFLTWYTGGLNYQIEHHLFPGIASVHYPKLSGIVRQNCEKFGVRYQIHETAIGALSAHVNHLKTMGMK